MATEPGPCYCGCSYAAHTPGVCTECDCNEFVEKAAVIQTRDSLDLDDDLDGERRRDNLPAALHIERVKARRPA